MRIRKIAVVLLFVAAAGGPLAAQPGEAAPTAPDAATATNAPAASAGAFDPEAATRAYLDSLTPEEKERSDSYFEGGYWLQLWGFLYGLGIVWLVLGTGLSARMRDLAERITKRGPVQTAIYTVQYLLLTAVLVFPLTVYSGFFREHQYDLSTQTFGAWFRDWIVGAGVDTLFSALAIPILYGAIRKAPRTWWVWGGGLATVMVAFILLIAPVYIDPLFNTYKPLADPTVREPILSMARANGVPADEVWEFDASRQSTRISANVSGFLGTMRVRLNDNLLERCTPAEVMAVMGHELGHYVLNHIYELLVEISLIFVVGAAFVAWSFRRVHARWGERWSIRGVGDVAGMPLLGILLGFYMLVITPIFNTVIRTNEAEADIFGLNASREPEGFAEVALKLGEYRKLDPGPVEEWFFFDHPSGRARIRMAMDWKAEHLAGMDGDEMGGETEGR